MVKNYFLYIIATFEFFLIILSQSMKINVGFHILSLVCFTFLALVIIKTKQSNNQKIFYITTLLIFDLIILYIIFNPKYFNE